MFKGGAGSGRVRTTALQGRTEACQANRGLSRAGLAIPKRGRLCSEELSSGCVLQRFSSGEISPPTGHLPRLEDILVVR